MSLKRGNATAGCECVECEGRRAQLRAYWARKKQEPGYRETLRNQARDRYARDPEKHRAKSRRDYATKGGREYQQLQRRRNPGAKHGIPPVTFWAKIRDQDNQCAICQTPFDHETPRKGPYVDHNHAHCPGPQGCCVCVRGLLCRNCNVGLGVFADDPARLARAIDYLKEWTQ